MRTAADRSRPVDHNASQRAIRLVSDPYVWQCVSKVPICRQVQVFKMGTKQNLSTVTRRATSPSSAVVREDRSSDVLDSPTPRPTDHTLIASCC
jgi:hypothetical protein